MSEPKVVYDHPDFVRENIRFLAGQNTEEDAEQLAELALALLDDLEAAYARIEVAYKRLDELTAERLLTGARPAVAELPDLIAKAFAEFLHQGGARQRPHDFADGLLIALGRGGYVVVPDDDDDQHVIEFRADEWTIKHPLSCRPNLFECPVNRVAGVDLGALDGPPAPPGRYECDVNDLGDRLLIGDRIESEANHG